ncbi:Hsp70 family protein [Marinitoga sp. 1138]|uniref:Hsp70 family protein n=1 Tax=Marinitoga sp. 1138 TaxID=1643334 RepID=UPI0015861F1B|nr:Hsp70 family protein [Marinitoga sp. 1138]NUU96908.1 hypothetical protein [Marinitoga sp. 1138]
MIYGIDFGTTNSLVAILNDKNRPEIIINERGKRLTPSVVYLKNEKEVLVGEMAKSYSYVKRENVIKRVKRDMGSLKKYRIFNKEFTPEEIGSFIFFKLKKYAEETYGKELKKAVVSVPAYFDDNQRQSVIKSANLAGIEVLKLINEPTAAALAYGVNLNEEKQILVLDLGGGTFDITLMNINNGIFEVINTGGSTHIGGADFDEIIAKWILEKVYEEHNIDLSTDTIALQQIYNNAEKAKMDLSSVDETNIIIPYISIKNGQPLHINLNFSNKIFRKISKNLIEEIKRLILETIKDFQIENIDEILLVGGASRMKIFKEIVLELFPYNEIKYSLNPDEIVVQGAALYAGIIEKTIQNIELKDILPHSLGILDDDGNFITILKKGIHYPCESMEFFTNTEDNQDTVIINVLQKVEDKLVSLGLFHFKSKRKWQKGEANLSVSFKLNKNGVLEVTAEDLDTGDTNELIITDTVYENKKDTNFINDYKII